MKGTGRIFCVLAVITGSAATWLNLSWKSIEQLSNSPSESRIDYYLNDFTLMATDANGKVRYHVAGQHLTHNQASGSSEIYVPLIEARAEDGELVTIKAQKAIQESKSGNITLNDEVKLHKPLFEQSPEFSLTTQNMTYRPSNNTISSMDDIELISEQGFIRGTGFETNLEEQELRILSNVQAEFNPAK
ncbi:LPS export ABC transporter periplasmic protein LptC [Leucothrix sargassi]|nr:LPS export ABC transporter periplasmic protein LptC [Leucothrix sargassi]